MAAIKRRRGSVRPSRYGAGRWEVRLSGTNPETRESWSVSRTVHGTRADADRKLAELVLESDRSTPARTATLNELLRDYIAFLSKRGRSPSTIKGYRSLAHQISLDPIGRTPVAKLSGHGIDKLYDRLSARGGTGDATINRYHSLLRGALKQAVKWRWIDGNPALLATPPAERRHEIDIPPDDVVAAVVEATEQTKSPFIGTMTRTLVISAARRGEACALRWPRVDLDNGFVYIRASIAESEDGLIEKRTKNYQSRTVPIDDETVAMLRQHRCRQEARAAKRGGSLLPNAFVFPNLDTKRGGCPNGTVPVRPSTVSQAFRRVCKSVPEADAMRLHDLRHWAASSMLDDGEPVTEVAARLGDHVETVVRTYLHRRRNVDNQSAQPLANRLGRAMPAP